MDKAIPPRVPDFFSRPPCFLPSLTREGLRETLLRAKNKGRETAPPTRLLANCAGPRPTEGTSDLPRSYVLTIRRSISAGAPVARAPGRDETALTSARAPQPAPPRSPVMTWTPVEKQDGNHPEQIRIKCQVLFLERASFFNSATRLHLVRDE